MSLVLNGCHVFLLSLVAANNISNTLASPPWWFDHHAVLVAQDKVVTTPMIENAMEADQRN